MFGRNLRNVASISTLPVEQRLKILELQISEVLSERNSVNKRDQSLSRRPNSILETFRIVIQGSIVKSTIGQV